MTVMCGGVTKVIAVLRMRMHVLVRAKAERNPRRRICGGALKASWRRLKQRW